MKVLSSLFLMASLSLLLPACRLIPSASNPPLPTVVPARDTPAPSPTEAAAEPTAPPPTATAAAADPSPTSTAVVEAAQPAPTDTATTAPPTATAVPEPTPTETSPPVSSEVAEGPVPLDTLTVNLQPVASGFDSPVYLTHAGDGSGRLFVVEQAGRVQIIRDGARVDVPFLDIIDLVGSDANEQGLLSLAFHPDYANNGRFFVYYTNRDGNVVIARYQVAENPDQADSTSGQILLTIEQPYANHNGGAMLFGPDGYLYLGLGDGGAANDPQGNGQSLNTLLGKVLRLDVDGAEPYGVPDSNPFVSTDGARPEIWSYGWRNPWRLSFDRQTNDMYVADVGQNQFEEVHVELAGAAGGQNYGWNVMEGFNCFAQTDCDPAALDLVLPVTEYDHSEGCSITGGYVYRGGQFPALSGVYFYGDFCSGTVWGLRREADGSWSEASLLATPHNITSFGEDEAGELYLIDRNGEVLQIRN
ncbi:MAG: PQQ-dependent sugar dehydrogenase [Anaerolineae bacterium]|nr:PQQ-dependent sugar dehydrogenase [Anaerolineae bacterium]